MTYRGKVQYGYNIRITGIDIEMNDNSGVYKITNNRTGDFYIGSTTNLRHRWSAHRSEQAHQERDKLSCPLLYAAMRSEGIDNFTLELIEECEPVREILMEREQHYLDELKPAYNRVLNAKGIPPNIGNKDFRHSEESVELIRQRAFEVHERKIEERGYYVSPEGIETAKVKRNAHFTPERRQQYEEETRTAREMAEQVRKEKADEYAKQFLPLIVEMQRKGLGMIEIAKEMNALGHKSRRGGPWTDQTVRMMLKRRPEPAPVVRKLDDEVFGHAQAKPVKPAQPGTRFVGWKGIAS